MALNLLADGTRIHPFHTSWLCEQQSEQKKPKTKSEKSEMINANLPF